MVYLVNPSVDMQRAHLSGTSETVNSGVDIGRVNGVYEFGDETPLKIQCEDGRVTLEDMISEKQITVLNGLFSGQDMKDEQKRLEMLDKYLSIPLVEAYFNPTSYSAFHRLVMNGCTVFPKYRDTRNKTDNNYVLWE